MDPQQPASTPPVQPGAPGQPPPEHLAQQQHPNAMPYGYGYYPPYPGYPQPLPYPHYAQAMPPYPPPGAPGQPTAPPSSAPAAAPTPAQYPANHMPPYGAPPPMMHPMPPMPSWPQPMDANGVPMQGYPPMPPYQPYMGYHQPPPMPGSAPAAGNVPPQQPPMSAPVGPPGNLMPPVYQPPLSDPATTPGTAPPYAQQPAPENPTPNPEPVQMQLHQPPPADPVHAESTESHPSEVPSEAVRSETPEDVAHDTEDAIDEFISSLKAKLDQLSHNEKIEFLSTAFDRLGMEHCIDAIVDTFGEDIVSTKSPEHN